MEEMILMLQNIARAFLTSGFGKGLIEFFSGKKISPGNLNGSSIILLVLLAVVILKSLAESISRCGQRERTVRECWKGKSRGIAAFLALAFGFVGVHRFYLRYIVTGIVQCVGTVAFIIGAWMLGNSNMLDFLMLTDRVSIGLFLFLGGLAAQFWHISDFYMILFGGMIPRRTRAEIRGGQSSAHALHDFQEHPDRENEEDASSKSMQG